MAKHKRNPSIVQSYKICYMTGVEGVPLDPHEPIGGKNKQESEFDGIWIWVTREKHRWLHDTEEGQEHNKLYQQLMQEYWMDHYHDEECYDFKVEKFIERYGKNYL